MVLRRLAALLDALPDRSAVAIDGPDAAGKTTMADALARIVDRPVVRASVDGFHRPRATRHRQGRASPVGYYRDSFDLAAFTDRLVQPFVDGADAVDTAVFDHRLDRPDVVHVDGISPSAVLICDGVFLLRPEVRDLWTLRVYLAVSAETTLRRAVVRDGEQLGSDVAVRELYTARYLPAHVLYRSEADPVAAAHVVIDNDDVEAPRVLRWTPPAARSAGVNSRERGHGRHG